MSDEFLWFSKLRFEEVSMVYCPYNLIGQVVRNLQSCKNCEDMLRCQNYIDHACYMTRRMQVNELVEE
jgi:hypothetical protein